jgi:hypothetical protein
VNEQQVNSTENGNEVLRLTEERCGDYDRQISKPAPTREPEDPIAVEQLCKLESSPPVEPPATGQGSSPNPAEVVSTGNSQDGDIDSSEPAGGDSFLCFCAPGDLKAEAIRETTPEQNDEDKSLVNESPLQSKDDGTVQHHRPEKSKWGLLSFSWPALCFSERDDREDWRDHKCQQVEGNKSPVSTLMKEDGNDALTAASSISLAQSSIGSNTSSSGSDESATYDDYSTCGTDDSTLATTRKARQKSYKLTVTFEPPTWLV